MGILERFLVALVGVEEGFQAVQLLLVSSCKNIDELRLVAENKIHRTVDLDGWVLLDVEGHEER